MTKEEFIISSFVEIYNRIVTLNSIDEKDSIEDIHPSEVHCIELIKRTEEANVTKLAEAAFMTRGAVSKITKKLLKHDAIVSYQKPENKKEIYFKLTDLGEEIYKMHEEMHKKWNDRDMVVFEGFSESEKDTIVKFLKTYNKHLEEEINACNLKKSAD